VAQVSKLNLRR